MYSVTQTVDSHCYILHCGGGGGCQRGFVMAAHVVGWFSRESTGVLFNYYPEAMATRSFLSFLL